MGRYAYKKSKKKQSILQQMSGRKRKYVFKNKLADKKINTLIEKRMEEIAKAEDLKDSWKISRVEHFADGKTFPSSHGRPAIADMAKMSSGEIFWQEITTPYQHGSNTYLIPTQFNIKTIQSRLRFYSQSKHPQNVRVAIIKINNSGKLGIQYQSASPKYLSQDISPNNTMIGDTSLRFSGIHSTDQKKIAPGQFGRTIIAQATFTIPGALRNDTDPAFIQKQCILTKTYKRFLSQQITQVETSAYDYKKWDTSTNSLQNDPHASADQNKLKITGDRLFLLIATDVPATEDLFFYGVSGLIYNQQQDQPTPTVSVPENAEIKSGMTNE